MASILDKYGIKEVADVTFYEIGKETKKPTHPVLYLDTLKVSTLEQTGEEAEARGGKGNAALIIWDYNKDITITLEDALFSAKSMAIMFGNGADAVQEFSSVNSTSEHKNLIMKTEQFTATASTLPTEGNSTSGWDAYYTAPGGIRYKKINPQFFSDKGEKATALEANKVYFCTYDLMVSGSVIEVSANSFPGTYYVTGDTYARSADTGKDEFFQLIIPKAKVTSENTLTMEAEGDPSVFNMNLRVLRGDNGELMKLVKYDLIGETDSSTTSSGGVNLVHNHNVEESYDKENPKG